MNLTSRLLIAAGLLVVSLLIAREARFAPAPSGAVDAISVITRYDGAFAEEVERTLSVPIEDALAALPSVIAVSSTSSRERSTVIARLAPRGDAVRTAAAASAAVERLSAAFPLAVSRPQVFLADPNQRAAFIIALPPDRAGERIELEQRFGRIDGVGRVQVVGSPGRDILVELREAAREAPGASLQELRAAIDTRNRVVGLGAARSRPVVIDGRTRGIAEVGDVPLAGGALVRDRAQVKGVPRPVDSITTVNGTERTLVYINAAAGADLFALSKTVGAEARMIGDALILRDLGAAARRTLLRVAAGAFAAVVIGLLLSARQSPRAAIAVTGFTLPAASLCAGILTALNLGIDTAIITAFSAGIILAAAGAARGSLIPGAFAALAASLPFLVNTDVITGIAPALGTFALTPLGALGFRRIFSSSVQIEPSWFRHRRTPALIAGTAAGAGILAAAALVFALRYPLGEWPIIRQSDAALNIEFPDGTTVGDVHAAAAAAASNLQESPGVAWTAVDARAGRADINIGLERAPGIPRRRKPEEWRDTLRGALENVPGGSEAQVFLSGGSTPRLAVWQWGGSHEEIRARARLAAEVLGSIRGGREITLGFKEERPEILLSIDPLPSALGGTTPRALVDELRWDIAAPVGVKILSGSPVDLRLRGRREIVSLFELQSYRSRRSGLDLTDTSKQSPRRTPRTIQRELRARAVPIFLEIDPGTEGAVQKGLNAVRGALEPRSGYSIGMGRETARRLAGRRRLGLHLSAGWLLCALAAVACRPLTPARGAAAAMVGAAAAALLLAVSALIGGTLTPFAVLASITLPPLAVALIA